MKFLVHTRVGNGRFFSPFRFQCLYYCLFIRSFEEDVDHICCKRIVVVT